MNLLCRHRSRSIGQTFQRCLVCQAWSFTLGGRWHPATLDIPWVHADFEYTRVRPNRLGRTPFAVASVEGVAS